MVLDKRKTESLPLNQHSREGVKSGRLKRRRPQLRYRSARSTSSLFQQLKQQQPYQLLNARDIGLGLNYLYHSFSCRRRCVSSPVASNVSTDIVTSHSFLRASSLACCNLRQSLFHFLFLICFSLITFWSYIFFRKVKSIRFDFDFLLVFRKIYFLYQNE